MPARLAQLRRLFRVQLRRERSSLQERDGQDEKGKGQGSWAACEDKLARFWHKLFLITYIKLFLLVACKNRMIGPEIFTALRMSSLYVFFLPLSIGREIHEN